MADDTVPKKNKKGKQERSSYASMEQEDEVTGQTKKGKKGKKAALDISKASGTSAFDRSSVKSGLSRKRQQSIEEVISALVG